MKIIIADDDETIRRVMVRVFSSGGEHEVETAADGKELLERWRKKRHALVISDIEMPRMTGLAACREIRRMDPSVRILFVTGTREEDLLREASLLGNLLDKPFSIAELLHLGLQSPGEAP